MTKFVISFCYEEKIQVREMDLVAVKIGDRYENNKLAGSIVDFVFEDNHLIETITVISSLKKSEHNVQKIYIELLKAKDNYNILGIREFEGIVDTIRDKSK